MTAYSYLFRPKPIKKVVKKTLKSKSSKKPPYKSKSSSQSSILGLRDKYLLSIWSLFLQVRQTYIRKQLNEKFVSASKIKTLAFSLLSELRNCQ